MKKETKMLIIGILIGAVVTAAIFMLVKPGRGNMPDFDKMPQFDKENFNKEDFEKNGGKRPSRNKNNTTDGNNATEGNVNENQE